jgi:Golgi nucleoside diphosphatase
MKYVLRVLIINLVLTFCAFSDDGDPANKPSESDLAIVIDAGSTGSRLYIYQIEDPKNPITTVKTLFNNQVSPGISTSINDIRATNEHLATLFNPAQRFCYQQKLNCADAPIHFLSTGGVRLERRSKQQQLFQIVRNWIDDFSIFRQVLEVRTISGEEEALLGWMSAYDKQSRSNQTVGAYFELGGASMQYAYMVEDPEKANASISYPNRKIHLNVGSWLGFGLNEATKRVVNYWRDSHEICYPKGYYSSQSFDYPKCFSHFDHYLSQNIDFDSLTQIITQITQQNKPIVLNSAFKYFFKDYFDAEQPATFQQTLKSTCQMSWESIRKNPKYAPMVSYHHESACANGTYILALFKMLGLPRNYPHYAFDETSWTQAVMAYWELKQKKKVLIN